MTQSRAIKRPLNANRHYSPLELLKEENMAVKGNYLANTAITGGGIK